MAKSTRVNKFGRTRKIKCWSRKNKAGSKYVVCSGSKGQRKSRRKSTKKRKTPVRKTPVRKSQRIKNRNSRKSRK